MLDAPNISNTAFVISLLGVVVGIVISILLYILPKSLNQRFVDKCRRESSYARAEVIKARRIFESGKDTQRVRIYRYIVTYEYVVNGKAYRKTKLVQASGIGRYDSYPTIYYSRNNPRKAHFAQQKNPAVGCLTGIVFAIVVMLLAVKLFP